MFIVVFSEKINKLKFDNSLKVVDMLEIGGPY